MDVKRNWPWKKKSDKSMPSGDSTETSSSVNSSGQLDDQDLSKIMQNRGTESLSEDASPQVQQLEEKLSNAERRLAAALKDISLKDDIVKQHTKIAEEAVSGWEKAEGEAVALRQQLDAALQQKLAAEDRVSHLDGALKECMRQLRHDREEREQKIHEAILKKTRDWDKMRCELEEKLEDVGQKLMETEAKGTAMSKSLKEQAITISQITEARSRAESEIEVLKVEFQSLESHNTSLKYEVHVLNKELEIRNEERELSRRTAEAANKQHLENVKKAAKLEAECQRLRALVRKKLPGPAALAQMKLEVDAVGKEKQESNRRRSIGRGGSSPKAEPLQSLSHDNVSKDTDALLVRLYAMEEEEKSLREALVKRNNELQSARLMCARTASKLSNAEQQLETFSHTPGVLRTAGVATLDMRLDVSTSLTVSKEPSQASLSEDGNDDEKSNAGSWASALIAELAQFKNGVPPQIPEKSLDPSGMDLMDDFVEMERLASMSESKVENRECGVDYNLPKTQGQEDKKALEEMLAKREADIEAANRLYEEAHSKLTDAQDELSALQHQLSTLQSQNASKELVLASLQEKLDMIFEAQDTGANIRKAVEEVRTSMGISSRNPVARLRAQINRLNKSSELSNRLHTAETNSEDESPASLSDTEATSMKSRAELTPAVSIVVRLVEDLLEGISTRQFGAFREAESENRSVFIEHTLDPVRCYRSNFRKDSEVDDCLRKFSDVSNQFLQGKTEIASFISELSSVLNLLYSQIRRKSFFGPTEQDEMSGVNSPISETSKSDGSEEAAKVVPANEQNGISFEISKMEEELSSIRAEKLALESQMATELNKSTVTEEEVARLKGAKVELESALRRERVELQLAKVEITEAEQLIANLKQQLCTAEIRVTEGQQLIANLRGKLSAVEESKNSANEQLTSMSASKSELESQLQIREVELKEVTEKMRSLEREILEESQRSTELKAQCQRLQEQLQHSQDRLSHSHYADSIADEEEDARLNKERELAEAAEKLAECQRTILALGNQLKSLASPNEFVHSNSDSPGDSASTIESILSGKKVLQAQSQNTGGRKPPIRPRREDQTWASQETDISEMLDMELANISKQGRAQKRSSMIELFGDRTPVHEDYIEAVALMPSSPESMSPPKSPVRRTPRKKKISSRSFTTIDPSKSAHEANSPAPSEKHGSSFSRFFSRNKSSH